MKILQRICSVLILTAIVSFGVLAQDQKDTPPKTKTPRVKVEEKEDNKKEDKNRGKDNKDDKDNKDRGDKKPPGMG